MDCNCEKYQHLELHREAIDRRIRETKKIKKNLEQVIIHQKDYSVLWKCPDCHQLWQSSEAWNWGAKDYVYKVPVISVEDWLNESFAKPDELLIYSAILSDFEKRNTFIEREVKCKNENCEYNAIQYSVFCKKHHIESLQKAKVLPSFPEGKLFEPYSL